MVSQQLRDGILIPAGLLVVGTAIVKIEWLPYAAALAVVLASLKFFGGPSEQVPAPTPTPNDAKVEDEKPVALKVLEPKIFQEYELKEKTMISHNVAIYRVALPTPESILGLPIGQHVSISALLPQTAPDGSTVEKEILRSYTPISGDEQPGYVDLLIKSYPTGNISKYMASLEVGQKLKMRGPKGAMVYSPNMVRHFGMIAGGTGITPMLQIIKAVIRGRAAGDKTEIDLLFANVNPEDILLKDELDQLAASDAGFRVHYVLNNPPEGWTGGVGFVTADMIEKLLPKAADDVKILLCGPPPMVGAMKKATEGLGFAKARAMSKLEDQVFAF